MISTDNTARLGVSIPGQAAVEAARDAVPPIDAVERMVAANLRQKSVCGQEWVRRLLNDPGEENALAALVSESGTHDLRRDLAGMKAQLQLAADDAERYRRALEVVTSNPHIAPANYPETLRQIFNAAFAR